MAGITRRDFLLSTGLTTAWALSASARGRPWTTLQGAQYAEPLEPVSFRVTRGTDLLNFEVELLNFVPVRQHGILDSGSHPQSSFGFHIASWALPGYVAIRFGGQHVAEQSIWDRPIVASADAVPKTPSPTYRLDRSERHGLNDDLKFLGQKRDSPELAGTWLAGHSQLVFEVPQQLTPLPFDIDEILELCISACRLRVHPRLGADAAVEEFFTGSGHAEIRRQRPVVGRRLADVPFTRIEFPSLLYISPYQGARWRLRPESWAGRYELWSLDLERASGAPVVSGRPRKVQAPGHLFALDTEERPGSWPEQKGVERRDNRKYGSGEVPKTSLYPATRKLLVGQMSEDNGDIAAHDFRLTSLGATADLEYRPLVKPQLPESSQGADGVVDGLTDRPGGFLTQWIQKTELGRDYFVKEAFAGYWLPFQFPGEAVTATERLFSIDAPPEWEKEPIGRLEGELTAFLVARKFGVLKDRVRDFGGPERDDFDDVGARLARSMGFRRVEVLVDRTPVLSNQATRPLPGDRQGRLGLLRERIRQGHDGSYTTGGSGEGAATEVFWPRISLSGEGRTRRLVPYRFPVRLTALDGTEIETSVPMMFCHELREGQLVYNEAPQSFRKINVGVRVPLTDPQPAAAINYRDLDPSDVPVLEEILRPDLNVDGKSPDVKSALLSLGATTMFGAAREQIFDHVEKHRDAIDRWCRTAVAAKADADVVEKIDSATKTLEDAYPKLWSGTTRRPGALSEARRRALRMIAWPADAPGVEDVGAAAKRLADGVDMVRAMPDSLSGSAVKVFVDHLSIFQDPPVKPHLKAVKPHLEALAQSLPAVGDAKDVGDLVRILPKLQIQWVAVIGPVWRRREWDSWFAQLFFLLETKAGASAECCVTALRRLIQERYALALMSPEVPDCSELLWLTAGEEDLPVVPDLSLVNRVGNPLAAPGDVRELVETATGRLWRDARAEGAGAVRRVVEAIGLALPENRELRRRAQELAIDYEYALSRGRREAEIVEAELAGLYADMALEVAHMVGHVEGAASKARVLLKEAASKPEHVTTEVRELEALARKRAADLSDRLAKRVSPKVDEHIRRMLEVPPVKSLQSMQKLVESTGQKLADEIESALMASAQLLKVQVEELKELQSEVRRLASASAPFGGPARALIARARARQEQLLDVVRREIAPWRGDLVNILSSQKDWPGPAEYALIAKTIVQRSPVPGELVRRVSELLRAIEPRNADPVSGAGEPAADPDRLEATLVAQWQMPSRDMADTLTALQRRAAAHSGEMQAEFVALRQAIEREVAAEPWTRLDEVELALLMLLGAAPEEARRALRRLLAGIAGSEVEEQLASAWREIGPKVEALQRKLNLAKVSASNLVASVRTQLGEPGATLISDVKNRLNAEFADLQTTLRRFGQLATDRSQNLVRKANLALECPSILESFRDESAKSVLLVEDVLLKMESAGDLFDSRLRSGFPVVNEINVQIPSVGRTELVEFTQGYLENGFRGIRKEAAGVFAEAVGVVSSATQEGGLAEVSAVVNYLSRDLGDIGAELRRNLEGAEAALRRGAADLGFEAPISQLLPPGSSKLFGVLDLEDVLATVTDVAQTPKVFTNELPDRVEKRFSWTNDLKSGELPGGFVTFKPAKEKADGVSSSKFRLVNETVFFAPRPGQPMRSPQSIVRGELDGFSISLASMLDLHFKSVSFTTEGGRFDFNPVLGRSEPGAGDPTGFVAFKGPLEAVDTVREELQALIGGRDGPAISIEEDWINAGYSISLPNLSFGAVAIDNLSLTMQLAVPLKSGPLAFLFRLSHRMEPFRVSVSGFAGGGYFGVKVSPDRSVCWVEGALEFGGSLSFNIAVADGELYLMAGIYFRLEESGTTISGYVRAGGRVSVLGFIQLVILFYLALFYRKRNGQTEFFGQCTVSVRVSIGFFKKTVRVSMERHFKGSKASAGSSGSTRLLDSARSFASTRLLPVASAGADSEPPPRPTGFADLFPDGAVWDAYWNSFAEV